MFSLLVSLGAMAQEEGLEPEGPPLEVQPCLDLIPINVSHNAFTPSNLPCMRLEQGTSSVFMTNQYLINIHEGFSNQGYLITSDKSIIVTQINSSPGTATQIGASFNYTYSVRFLESGWHNLTITSVQLPIPTTRTRDIDRVCEIPVTLKIPVLCECPNFNYDILGRPEESTILESQDVGQLSNRKHIVIGDLDFNCYELSNNQSQNVTVQNADFIVLGKNSYHQNQPGGIISGPTMRVTTMDPFTGVSTLTKRLFFNNSKFYGTDCFGMWNGIEVMDSTLGGLSKINFTNNCRINDARIGLNILPGSLNAVHFTGGINNCLYGLITRRSGLSASSVPSINTSGGGCLFKKAIQ